MGFSRENFKTIARGLLVTCLLSLILPSISTASDKSYNFKIVNSDSDKNSPMGRSMQLWADLIAEKSDGRMTARVFHRGELGGVPEVFDHLMRGNIDMLLSLPQTSYDKRLGVMSLPYLAFSWEGAADAFNLDGWMTKVVAPVFENIGIKFFGLYPYGFAGYATKGKFAVSYEEADNLKIKVRSIPAFPIPQTVKAMGFHSVPLDWNEVYTSIQTGVVDGDSANTIYWDYSYFGDQLDYYVHTKHLFSYATVMMNLNAWENLDDEDKEIVRSSAREVITKQFLDAEQEEKFWIDKAQADGMEYITPSVEDTKHWAKLVRSEVWGLAEEKFGKDLMDEVRAHAVLPE